MRHSITFDASFDSAFGGFVSRAEVRDAIELFFEGPVSVFVIKGSSANDRVRGLCLSHGKSFHTITLFSKTIKEHVRTGLTMGGNKPHVNPKVGALSVLVHELRHAMQASLQDYGSSFWNGRYFTRTAEVDARRWADMHEDAIMGMVEGKLSCTEEPMFNTSIQDIIDVLSMADEVSMDDVVEELKREGLHNSVNLGKVVHVLIEQGKLLP